MSDVQLAVLAALDSALTSVGARWYLFGAQAVALYGVPRLTADIDATIDAELDQLTNVVAALRDSGFRLLGLLEQALDRSDLIDELEQARPDAARGL